MSGWRPTGAMIRMLLGGAALTVLALAAGRPALLVIAAPLLLLSAGALVWRPVAEPSLLGGVGRQSLGEGQGTRVSAVLGSAGGVEHASLVLSRRPFLATRPSRGVMTQTGTDGRERRVLEVAVSPRRWGRHAVGAGVVACTSGWGGFGWDRDLVPSTVWVAPSAAAFDSRASTPHPVGLVGAHRSQRVGDGSEFAGIRPFHAGDRLRRIQWPVSLRAGELHVTTTHAEEDTSILLLVDATVDVGTSEGIDGSPSSLDVTVRAAAAMAEHYLHGGDRVGVRVLGAGRYDTVPVGGGRRHLRRVLDTLAAVVPGRMTEDPGRLSFGTSGGTVVMVLSPLLSDAVVRATLGLARRGLDVIVLDPLPAGALDLASREARDAAGDGLRAGVASAAAARLTGLRAAPDQEARVARLAWRLRLLEREELLARVARAGIPVVTWRGPGSVDEVLRRLARRAAMPRLSR